MAEKVIDLYSKGKQPEDINDYLELYQTTLFVDNNICSDKWDDEKQKEIKGYISIVAKYLHSITAEDVPNLFSLLEFEYTDVFWDVVDKFNIKGLITKENIKAILTNQPYALKEILKNERLVKENNKVLADLLKEQEHAAEYLLEYYVEEDKFDSHRKKIHIPSALSIEDKDKIISDYLDWLEVNLNYVRLIVIAKNTPEFHISDSTRLKAKRKEKELNDKVLKEGHSIPITYTIQMSDAENAPIKDLGKGDDLCPTLIYNSHILQAQDAEGLMQYCAFVFEWTNRMGLISLIVKRSDDGLDVLFGMSAITAYRTNSSFHSMEYISMLQIVAMQNILSRDGRSIESMLKKFYEDNLSQQFNYNGMPMDFANPSNTWEQKCKIILPLMDNIAHQYTAFVKNGTIDPDFVAIMSPMKITDVPSCITKKYFVINGQPQELYSLFHLFFSNQCMLNYVDPYKDKHYHNFYELIRHEEKINYNNYEQYQKLDLEYLIQRGYLSVTENGEIQVNKIKEILILKHLYEYHACPLRYFDNEGQNIILDMAQKEWLLEDNHLLTPEERDYFSYYLNNEKFSNGPALRNKYMHGATIGNSEAQHQTAYYRILNLLILLLIKIYDDLRLKQIISNS